MTDIPNLYRIGRVSELLAEEFPDISISKLRFLQDKGIVEPARTSGGYRMYSDADVEALRAALRMQRDEFLPLKVIKQELSRRLAEGRGAATAPSAATTGDTARGIAGVVGSVIGRSAAPAAAGAARVDLAAAPQLVSADALVRAAGVSFEFLEECRAADIVTGQRSDDGLHLFTTDEVELVTRAGALTRLGLDVRHVRQAVMAAARQGAIVEQYAAALLRAPGADQHERAVHSVEELTGELLELLRVAFVRDVRTMVERTSGGAATSMPSGMPLV